MSDVGVRVPPGDPWDIRLGYHHRHPWWAGADDAPESWDVSADILDDGDTDVVSHVGDIEIVIVDLADTTDAFGLLDGESADLGLIAEVILDLATGRLDDELDRHLEPIGSRIVILDSVWLTPAWRGHGMGVLLAGTAIRKLSGGARRAAVCYPRALDGPAADKRPGDPAAIWTRLGFQHFRHGVHVLDLNLVTLDDSLRWLRRRIEPRRSLR